MADLRRTVLSCWWAGHAMEYTPMAVTVVYIWLQERWFEGCVMCTIHIKHVPQCVSLPLLPPQWLSSYLFSKQLVTVTILSFPGHDTMSTCISIFSFLLHIHKYNQLPLFGSASEFAGVGVNQCNSSNSFCRYNSNRKHTVCKWRTFVELITKGDQAHKFKVFILRRTRSNVVVIVLIGLNWRDLHFNKETHSPTPKHRHQHTNFSCIGHCASRGYCWVQATLSVVVFCYLTPIRSLVAQSNVRLVDIHIFVLFFICFRSNAKKWKPVWCKCSLGSELVESRLGSFMPRLALAVTRAPCPLHRHVRLIAVWMWRCI